MVGRKRKYRLPQEMSSERRVRVDKRWASSVPHPMFLRCKRQYTALLLGSEKGSFASVQPGSLVDPTGSVWGVCDCYLGLATLSELEVVRLVLCRGSRPFDVSRIAQRASHTTPSLDALLEASKGLVTGPVELDDLGDGHQANRGQAAKEVGPLAWTRMDGTPSYARRTEQWSPKEWCESKLDPFHSLDLLGFVEPIAVRRSSSDQ